MEGKVKKLQVMSYMLAVLWAVMFVANVIQEVIYWRHYEELKDQVIAPFVVLLVISFSWLVISILHFFQARALGRLETPEAISHQRNAIKSKLIAAIVILVLSMPVKIALHGYMDTATNATTNATDSGTVDK